MSTLGKSKNISNIDSVYYLAISWWITNPLGRVVAFLCCFTDGLLAELDVALLAVVLAANLLGGGGVGGHVGDVALGVCLVDTLLDWNLLDTYRVSQNKIGFRKTSRPWFPWLPNGYF